MVIDAATASPSTEIGSSHERQPSPASSASARMCSYEATAATPATASTEAVVTHRPDAGTPGNTGAEMTTGSAIGTGMAADGADRGTDAPLRRSTGNAIWVAATVSQPWRYWQPQPPGRGPASRSPGTTMPAVTGPSPWSPRRGSP